MRVYVAGSSGELERAESVMERLRVAGATITHDWTADIRAAREAGFASDADLPDDVARKHAKTDRDAVMDADVFLLLAPTTPTRGAWFELGIASAFCGFTMVAGPAARSSIFTRLADELHETDETAIALIAGMVSQ